MFSVFVSILMSMEGRKGRKEGINKKREREGRDGRRGKGDGTVCILKINEIKSNECIV